MSTGILSFLLPTFGYVRCVGRYCGAVVPLRFTVTVSAEGREMASADDEHTEDEDEDTVTVSAEGREMASADDEHTEDEDEDEDVDIESFHLCFVCAGTEDAYPALACDLPDRELCFGCEKAFFRPTLQGVTSSPKHDGKGGLLCRRCYTELLQYLKVRDQQKDEELRHAADAQRDASFAAWKEKS